VGYCLLLICGTCHESFSMCSMCFRISASAWPVLFGYLLGLRQGTRGGDFRLHPFHNLFVHTSVHFCHCIAHRHSTQRSKRYNENSPVTPAKRHQGHQRLASRRMLGHARTAKRRRLGASTQQAPGTSAASGNRAAMDLEGLEGLLKRRQGTAVAAAVACH